MTSRILLIPALRRAPRRGFLRLLAAMEALRRQRAHLARLDDHALRDIGLDRISAMNEAARPLWDAPDHWHGPSSRK